MRRTHYAPEHEEYRRAFREFLAREVVPHQERWLAEGLVDRQVWKAAGAAGFLLPWAQPRHGGLGLTDFRYEQVLVEELGAVGESGLAIPLHSAVIAPYLREFGSADQQDRFLPGAVSGQCVLALAITEPDAGSDVSGIRTRAVRDGADWVLSGAKTFISNGIHADLVIVAARGDSGDRHAVGLFLVAADSPGFGRGRRLAKLGLHSQDTAELFFDEVRVAAADVLIPPATGFRAITSMFTAERLSCALISLASAEYAFGLTVGYVRQRRAFGRALAEFQDARFKIARMRTELDVCQAYLDRCVLALEAGDLTGVDAAQAKLFASELVGRVTDTCVQLHGGYGYMLESAVCRAYADARVHRIYAGASEIMTEIIGRAVLAEPGGEAR